MYDRNRIQKLEKHSLDDLIQLTKNGHYIEENIERNVHNDSNEKIKSLASNSDTTNLVGSIAIFVILAIPTYAIGKVLAGKLGMNKWIEKHSKS